MTKNERLRRHKLLTKELIKRFAELGEQDIPNPIVVTKFFHPFSNWEWYATAYAPSERLFFGWVNGASPELGYFSLDELEEVVLRGIPIERDCFWKETRLSDIKAYQK